MLRQSRKKREIFFQKEHIPPFFASRNRLRHFPKRENASQTINLVKKWIFRQKWTLFGWKKLIYLAFLAVNLTEKVISSYAEHFPTILESRFEKKIFDPWTLPSAAASRSRNFFFKF